MGVEYDGQLYKSAWLSPNGLWRLHLKIALAVFAISFILGLLSRQPPTPNLITSAVAALLSVAWFPLFPIFMTKKSERTLTIDEVGIRSTIGKKFGERKWQEIRGISDNGRLIYVVTNTGNAYVIPQSAFSSDVERSIFVRTILEYYQASVPTKP